MPSVSGSLLPALASLLAVLGLVILAGRAVRRWGGLGRGWRPGLLAPTGARLAVAETLALDRVRRLTVVRCDGREVLLVTGGPRDLVVGWLAAPGEGAP